MKVMIEKDILARFDKHDIRIIKEVSGLSKLENNKVVREIFGTNEELSERVDTVIENLLNYAFISGFQKGQAEEDEEE